MLNSPISLLKKNLLHVYNTLLNNSIWNSQQKVWNRGAGGSVPNLLLDNLKECGTAMCYRQMLQSLQINVSN